MKFLMKIYVSYNAMNCIEDQIGKSVLPISSMESPVTARLLVATVTVNCLRGNEGQVISEFQPTQQDRCHLENWQANQQLQNPWGP